MAGAYNTSPPPRFQEVRNVEGATVEPSLQRLRQNADDLRHAGATILAKAWASLWAPEPEQTRWVRRNDAALRASWHRDVGKCRSQPSYNPRSSRRLKPHLIGDEGDEPASYRELADALVVSEGSLRVAVHRLRKEFKATLREAIAETVERDEDVDDELRYLLKVVGRQT